MAEVNRDALWELGLNAIKELASEEGVLASGRNEAYGCIFGRDSLIVALHLLRAYDRRGNPYLLEVVQKILRSLANLQGRATVPESGEEPGKIIHEYRTHGHEHLTKLAEDPWYLYPEGVMRNYDSVDATPLFLIAVDEYRKRGDERFANTLLPAVREALHWLTRFSGFVTYAFSPTRKHGGLRVQSWMDSTESLFDEASPERPPYPIAPVEAQAYAWSAYKRWGEDARAAELKRAFNEAFIIRGRRSLSLAYALDGRGKQLTAPRSSMGHVLWAAVGGECILASEHIPGLRNRLMARDLFVPQAGIRTLSSLSTHYHPQSYHNGSIWPHDTAILAEGLENFGYTDDANRVRHALLSAYAHFKTPVELFTYDRGLKPYKSPTGHEACKVQAWSAAALLALLE